MGCLVLLLPVPVLGLVFPECMFWGTEIVKVFDDYKVMDDSTVTRHHIGRHDQGRPMVKQSFRLLAAMKQGTLLSKFACLWTPGKPA